MNQKIKISTTQNKIKSVIIFISAAALFVVCINMLELDIEKFLNRLKNAGNILSKLMSFDLSKTPDILSAMLSTICIALAALVTGCVISVILAFLAAENIAPNKIISVLIKSIVAVVRAVPALVWILMVVASMGFGNTGGMVGLIFPTAGYLTKSFIASIEELGYNTIEAMRSTGANWFAIVFRGLVPNLTTQFISWTAIRAEGNIAESINLGMIGVTGVGTMLMRALGKYDYKSITTIIIVIFITMLIIEILVNQLKKAIRKAN